MKRKPGQMMSVCTKDNKKYLVRIKKATLDDLLLPCTVCHFRQVGRINSTLIKESCMLSRESMQKCISEVAPFCYLQIIRECKTL